MTHPARKRFGQHFLHDPAVIDRILRAIAPLAVDAFVEIGPGRGALTCPLVSRLRSLDVVEIDRDILPILEQRCGSAGTLRIHNADALQFDFAKLSPGPGALRVVGNLPYNVSTPLLFHLLRQGSAIRDMHFMLQKEVAERLVASPGSRAYGRLTLTVGYRCKVERLFTVGAGAFSPAPRVDSTFVRLLPLARAGHPAADDKVLEDVIRRAFSSRRKQLRNALRGLLDEGQMRALQISPNARPDALTLDQYVRLANAIGRLQSPHHLS